MGKYFLLFIIFITLPAHADQWSPWLTVEKIKSPLTSSHLRVYVHSNASTVAASCSNTSWASLENATEDRIDRLLSILIYAHSSGKKLSFHYDESKCTADGSPEIKNVVVQ